MPSPVAEQGAEVAYKLLRWPPVSLLRRDPARIRMASLMGRRYLTVRELATAADLSLDEVRPFVHNLAQVGLVEERQTTPTLIEVAARPAAPAKGFFSNSLISGIRKRLGLRLARAT